MIFMYSDGYVNDASVGGSKAVGPGQVEPRLYPAGWLREVGWAQGPGYAPKA